MWLPPLRPVLPEGTPVGINLGAFKPQREMERAFWPGPPGNWEPWGSEGRWDDEEPVRHPGRWRLRGAAIGLAGVVVVVAGAAVPFLA